jgi:hypothetical protein
MDENWTWTYQRTDGTELTDVGLSSVTFPDQAEAEAWLSGEWATLADAGVGQVVLRRDGDPVYGPMSLSPAD